MELLAAIVIGVLFTCGVYLMLARNILRIVLGTALLTYATNLMLLTVGLLKRGGAPVLGEGSLPVHTDPLPQALVLTAIVIGFAITAFAFVLAYRAYEVHGTENMTHMLGVEDE